MRPLAIPVLLLFGLALAGPAPARAGAPNEVEGVEITAPKDPAVVSSYPGNGTTIQGGTVVLKLVFDQAMTGDAWSYAPAEGGAFPNCLARPRLLRDNKTFVLLCSLPSNGKIAFTVNIARGFVSEAGRAAKPFTLAFATADRQTNSIHDALVQAGLTDADNPIMDWKGVAGISTAAAPPPVAP